MPPRTFFLTRSSNRDRAFYHPRPRRWPHRRHPATAAADPESASVKASARKPRYQSYREYQDSGRGWIGAIPSHWRANRLKTVLAVPVSDGPHETPEFVLDGVPFLSVDGIQDGELRFDGCRYVSHDDHHRYRRKCAPRRDDVLMGKAASTGKIARVKVDFEFGIWSPLALIRVNQEAATPAFVEYALKAPETQAQIDVLCNANTQKNIGMADIPSLVLPLPPLLEQRAIAAFLDRETANLDELIAKKERLIELLQEQRAAVITHAVTRGLDPTAPMKDSGVEWLGEVPQSWNLRRVRDVVSLLQTGPFGSQLHASEYVRDGVAVINPSNMAAGRAVSNPEITVTPEVAARLARHRCELGDILFARRGDMGRCALVNDAAAGSICGTGSLLIRADDALMNPAYLHLVLSSRGVREWLELESVGSTMNNLNASIVGQIPVLVPPLSEQRTIVTAAEIADLSMNGLQSRVLDAIERLREYRSALISAAVTGNIDVRDEVA